ncbi:UbiA prenyltransferase family protein [Marinactinospora rubrisoli]|uniref:UbiA prenyltransferase family protein n=1 Tax=Marinactinospora rubrisoli TaxID=2715399 RepID=A0ABW2K9D1_9ACTN
MTPAESRLSAPESPPTITPSARPARRWLRVPRALLRVSRPHQWLKNPVVIALPAVTMSRWDPGALLAVLWATALFTLASIAVYTLNDILDRERDRRHPVKRNRPIASGELGVATAWCYLGAVSVLLAAGIVLASPARTWPVLAYLVINLAYSFRLKHVSVVDAFTVAAGFALRALVGYLVLDAAPSPWLLLTVLSACLLLSFGKRRRELSTGSSGHRPALLGYSVQLADYFVIVSAALALACYTLFLLAEPGGGGRSTVLIVVTVAAAVFGLFRYLQILVVGNGGGDPVRTLIGDQTLLVAGLLWAVVFLVS